MKKDGSGTDATSSGATRWIAGASVVALYLAFGAFQVYDYDTPLHVITGQYLIEEPSSAGKNLFSFTNPDFAWVNDKWLANVVVYVVDAVGGVTALVAFRMLLLLALAAAIWTAMRNATAGPLARAVPLSLLPFVAYERVVLRPGLFSLILIAVMLWFVSRPRRSKRDWIVVLALEAIWVNLHGYWIVGPLIVIAFLAGDLVESWTTRRGGPPGADADDARARARHRGVLLAAAVGGGFLSPWPLALFLNPFQVLGFLGRKEGAIETVAEMLSPFNPNAAFNLVLPIFKVASVAVLAALLVNLRRSRPSHWFLAAGFFVMAAMLRRNIAMFAIVGAVVTAWSLGATAVAWSRSSRGALMRRAGPVLLVILVAGNAVTTWSFLTDRFYIADNISRRTGLGMSRLTYPTGLADFLEREQPPLRFFNDFVSGNYLAYRLYPDYPIFIAGNTFKYSSEFFDEYFLISLGGDAYKRAVDRYDLNAFAIQYKAPDMIPLAQRLFNDRDWVPVYFDDNALLFVRDVPEMAALIAAHRVDFVALARQRASEMPEVPPRAWYRRAPFPRGDLNRGTFLHRVGHHDLAEVEYRRALQVDPDLFDARHALADVVLAQNRFQEARELFDELLQEAPDDGHLLRDLFETLSGTGSQAAAGGDWRGARDDLEAAIQALSRAKGLDPTGDPKRVLEATDQYNLGFALWKLAQGGSSLDRDLEARSEAAFRAALSLQPQDPGLLYRMARMRVRQDRVEEALTLLEDAVRHGGIAYLRQAVQDPELATLQEQPRFRRLLESGAAESAQPDATGAARP